MTGLRPVAGYAAVGFLDEVGADRVPTALIAAGGGGVWLVEMTALQFSASLAVPSSPSSRRSAASCS
jgi:hypothetical protein